MIIFTIMKPTINDPCPHCGGQFKVAKNAFFVAQNYYDGIVCKACKALYQSTDIKWTKRDAYLNDTLVSLQNMMINLKCR
jgi:hypothetical protein